MSIVNEINLFELQFKVVKELGKVGRLVNWFELQYKVVKELGKVGREVRELLFSFLSFSSFNNINY